MRIADVLVQARALDGWQEARERQRREAARVAERDAFEERAAIIEEGAKVPRSTAERWARACLARVRGAL